VKIELNALQKSVEICFRKFADFQGRASRPEFWWFFAFQVGVLILTSLLGSVLNFLAFAALAAPALAVGARRLHDTGRSAWLLLLMLIPLIGSIALLYFAAEAGEPDTNMYGVPPSAN
jgi:uncharacterized membrane protein YhaH (DUF805 family)